MAERVLLLQRASYRVEADLIGFDGIPPLHETLAALRACGETFRGDVRDGGALAGALSYRREGGLVDIHRLMVDPGWFRRGVASGLLADLLEREADAARFVVSTGAANAPAIALYERLGFVRAGEREVAPGVLLAELSLHR